MDVLTMFKPGALWFVQQDKRKQKISIQNKDEKMRKGKKKTKQNKTCFHINLY